MSKNNKLLLPCDETPNNCNFLLACYSIGETFSNKNKGVNYIVFCQEQVACSAKRRCTGAIYCSCPAWLTAGNN
mgnify:FL=1|jgi:hypothetical protein